MKPTIGTRGNRGRWGRRSSQEGMALITVVILGLVFSVLGISLFAMTGYEHAQVSYRDQSASAFWLAEAAIEHMKGEVFRQLQWNVGFDSIPKGEGWYNLSVIDTTYGGRPAKYIFSQGFVRRPGGGYVERDIEVFADVSPAAFEYALFAMNDIDAGGNAGVCGRVHSNGVVNIGGSALDQEDADCPGGNDHISEDFLIYPPAIRTDPRYYPSTSYYYVLGNPIVPAGNRAWVATTDTAGTPLASRYVLRNGVTVSKFDSVSASYSLLPQPRVNLDFSTSGTISALFDQETGKCRLRDEDGDQFVVVNFGEYVQGGITWKANLEINDSPSFSAPIVSSVINARYTSADTSIAALTDSINWTGGNTTLRQVRFIPSNGIAAVIYSFDVSGPSNLSIGSPTQSALFYITGSITGNANANGDIYGTTIVLGIVRSLRGNITFHYDGDYQEQLPAYLHPFWQNPSGHVDVLLWREVPPKYSS
jgi:hypothetical protein